MKLSYRRVTLWVTPRMLHKLGQRMRYVKAAGGIVESPDGQLLMILRNGRWDLPKGKVEAGETLRTAAAREVEEETGVRAAEVAQVPLLKTYHIYNLYGGWHLKQTSWFEMKSHSLQNTAPQEEEGISSVEWANAGTWHQRLSKSYGTLKLTAWKHSHR